MRTAGMGVRASGWLSAAACVAALVRPVPAVAQGDLTDKLPLWQPGRAVTTSIKDALPVVTALRGPDEDDAQPIPDNFAIPPGLYRSVIRSYCLHAGAYGPTTGDGYLVAPLKGDRVPLIRNVLIRSVQYPNIEQHDVQRLIWGIEDGAQWDNFDNGFKQRVAPLLTTQEIAVLNLEPKRAEAANSIKRALGGLIPSGIRNAVDTYADLRGKITGITDFSELERIAVKTGVAPWGKDSRRDVQPGPWASIGNGFYIRAFPDSYPTTTLEVYRVVPAKLTRDDKGRITRFDSGGWAIETAYADATSSESVGGQQVNVWRFKSVTFRHPDGRTYTVQNQGYVVARADAVDVPGGGTRLSPDDGLGDFGHYRDGIKKAANPLDKKGQLKWVVDHLNRVDSAYDAANGALAGSEGGDATPAKLDPTPWTASPANTSKQRLALSAFKKSP